MRLVFKNKNLLVFIMNSSRSINRRRPRKQQPRQLAVSRPIKRRPYGSTGLKNAIHQFSRMTSTNQRTNLEAITTNYWAINNRSLNSFSYGGTTPNVFGNQISIYFDLLSVHMDLYSDAGALITQVEYGLPSVAEFVALYEEFRIDWVQIDCFASSENAYRAGTSVDPSSQIPIIYYVKDYNDPDSTSLTQMMQHPDVGMWQPAIGNQGSYQRTIRVKPRVNFSVANASMVGAGTAKVPQLSWLTTEDSQSIPHYGVKMAANTFFPTGDALNTQSVWLGFQFTYHMSFKNAK